MGIRRYNPTSPGRRGASVSDFVELTKGYTVESGLTVRKKMKGGRNNQGKITARHRGGGHKQQYRMIDFRRNKDGVPARVDSIQYDPNRTARIALLFYEEGRFTPSGFVHVGCLPAYCETAEVMPRVRQFSPALTDSDAAEIASQLVPN